jgi:hypothetical protein
MAAGGPSLLQARSRHLSRHTTHQRRHHAHSHEEAHRHKERDGDIDVRQEPEIKLDSIVTEVVQTVSVVQYLDSAGSVIAISTHFSPPIVTGVPVTLPTPEVQPPTELPVPPVEDLPVEIPPVELPPVDLPPVEIPPVETPPVEIPPVELPPVEIPTISADIPTPPIDSLLPSQGVPPLTSAPSTTDASSASPLFPLGGANSTGGKFVCR